MRAEDLKSWLAGVVAEEKEGEEGAAARARGAGDKWRTFVELVQSVWETGEIPRQLRYIIIVLIPKGNSGDYRGIGLMEPIWKVIEGCIELRLQILPCHEALHGGLQGKGTGTAIMEMKLAQQWAFIEQTPLYGIFVDLRKAFDAMDRKRTLDILADRGVGPKTLRLIRTFWELAEMVCRAGGSYGRRFKAGRGVTQGGPLSPRLFNLMVDAVVREWLRQVLGEEVASGELGLEIRRLLTCFYVDDGVLASTDPTFLQDAFDRLVDLFERVGSRTNTTKTEAMTFLPGKIRTCLSEQSYTQRMEGLGSNRRAETRRTSCYKCGKELAVGSLPRHLSTQHDVHHQYVPPPRLGEEVEDGGEQRFVARREMDGYYCPVEGCAAPRCRDFSQMRRHFWSRHPTCLVECPRAGCPRRCRLCGIQTADGCKPGSRACRRREEVRGQRRAAAESHAALDVTFKAYDKDTLKRVELFKYLGRQVSFVDCDVPAMRANLKKARGVWARVSKILREENVPPRVGGMFYRGIIMSVLLYGSETWCLPQAEMRALEGFHVAAARVLTGMRPKQAKDGTWTYPHTEEVLKRAGLRTISEYIGQRRTSIARKIRTRPIMAMCEGAERRRGTPPRQYWREQDLEVELPPLVGDDDVEEDCVG